MTTFPDRPHRALLVVDVQNGVVDGARHRDQVVATIAGLVRRAREAGAPVVWIQHSSDELVPDSGPWQLVPELEPTGSEPVVHKRHGDSFEATDLEQVLAELRVGHVVVVGAQTDACIRATLHGAFVRGYDTTLVSDAHTTEDLTAWGAPDPGQVIAHTNLYWQFQTGPGREAVVVGSEEISFA
ncbi:MAG TPA: cysteine hydrolase family protein [Marmoricola sp.]|nr:cysteine hydrolase family protein [Marmoricola sp.]